MRRCSQGFFKTNAFCILEKKSYGNSESELLTQRCYPEIRDDILRRATFKYSSSYPVLNNFLKISQNSLVSKKS